MELVLLFACILVSVALAGESLLGFLCAFAACQFVGLMTWIVASGLKHGS